MDLSDLATLATIITGALAITGVLQWVLARKQLFLQVMSTAHDRYSQLYPVLSTLPSTLQKYDDLSTEQKQAISAYVNLCSEQFYWWRWRKLVDRDVWRVWDTAIAEKFQHPAIRLAWRHNHVHDTYYKGFKEYVEAKVQNDLRSAQAIY